MIFFSSDYPALDAVLNVLVPALVGLLSTRFPVVGPLLAALLNKLLGPSPSPSPSPAPAPLPSPSPSPSPLPLVPSGPLWNVLKELLRKLLEDKLKAGNLEPHEMEALVQLRRE